MKTSIFNDVDVTLYYVKIKRTPEEAEKVKQQQKSFSNVVEAKLERQMLQGDFNVPFRVKSTLYINNKPVYGEVISADFGARMANGRSKLRVKLM